MSEEIKNGELNEEELAEAAGGNYGGPNIYVGGHYITKVAKGYLALRNELGYDSRNEIGPLWNGSKVTVVLYNGGDYATVAVDYCAPGPWGPDVSGRVGFVNINYLTIG